MYCTVGWTGTASVRHCTSCASRLPAAMLLIVLSSLLFGLGNVQADRCPSLVGPSNQVFQPRCARQTSPQVCLLDPLPELWHGHGNGRRQLGWRQLGPTIQPQAYEVTTVEHCLTLSSTDSIFATSPKHCSCTGWKSALSQEGSNSRKCTVQ
jgi:hypothetical protein